MQRARHVHQRVLEHPLDAGGAIGEAPPVGGLEVDRLVRVARTAEQLDESRRIRPRGRRMVLEVVHVESECAVRRAPYQLAHIVGQGGTPIGGEAHDLVFVLVHGEAEPGGERGIQQAERVGISNLAKQRDVRAGTIGAPLAMADRQRGPFADAVGGQDRRAPRGSGEERGSGVRMVVAGAQDLRPRDVEMRGDDAAHPHFFAERILDGTGERPPGARERPQRAGQDPIELPHAALVEDHRVEVGWLETGVIQAPFDGPERKAGVVLVPRQSFFLHGANRHAVDHERGSRIVVVRGNPEDLHLNTGWSANLRPAGQSGPSQPARGARRVWPARRKARAQRNT